MQQFSEENQKSLNMIDLVLEIEIKNSKIEKLKKFIIIICEKMMIKIKIWKNKLLKIFKQSKNVFKVISVKIKNLKTWVCHEHIISDVVHKIKKTSKHCCNQSKWYFKTNCFKECEQNRAINDEI